MNHNDVKNVDLRYTVPITYATNLSPDFKNLTPATYLNKWDDITQLSFAEPIDWIVLNLKQSNFYRVQYAPSLLKRIQEALSKQKHSKIAVENRAALIDDLFNFALIGLNDYVEVFQFMEYMRTETHYIAWYAAYVGLDKVAKRLTPHQLPNFAIYLSDITEAALDKLDVGWSVNDTILDVYNRNKLVSWLCKYQSANCEARVQTKFDEISEKPSRDYRETFYCAASKAGRYAVIMKYFQAEANPAERELLWRAASCTREYQWHYYNEILSRSISVSLKTVGLAQLYEQNPDLITNIFFTVTADITQLARA